MVIQGVATLRATLRGVVALAPLLMAFSVQAYDPTNRAEYLAKVKEAEALYKEKCATVAGIKIYKTLPDVEGVLLLKVRPNRTDRELADPMWPGAAFGREVRGDSYIVSFLGNESPTQGPIDAQHRGIIGTKYPPNLGSLPGYRWVEAIDPQDGQRHRYTLEYKEVTHISSITIGGTGKPFTVKENVLTRSSASKLFPRYGVTFQDHVIPEERALWVASSTVKVLDLKTNEVLGEMTIYAISKIHIPRYSMPWLNHSVCPVIPGPDGQDTRKFVDQILIPKRGE